MATLPSKLRPQHHVCKFNVAVPTLHITRVRPQTLYVDFRITEETGSTRPLEEGEHREVAVQWFGESDDVDLGTSQFYFGLPTSVYDNAWGTRMEKNQVIFLGPVRRWPNEDAVHWMAESMTKGNLDGWILWFASADHGTRDSNGRLGPACNALPFTILLADPVVGVIRPKFFSDISVLDRVKEEFARTSRP